MTARPTRAAAAKRAPAKAAAAPAAEITLSDIETMTSTQVMAAIDAGKLSEPKHHYRVLDGYYSRRM